MIGACAVQDQVVQELVFVLARPRSRPAPRAMSQVRPAVRRRTGNDRGRGSLRRRCGIPWGEVIMVGLPAAFISNQPTPPASNNSPA